MTGSGMPELIDSKSEPTAREVRWAAHSRSPCGQSSAASSCHEMTLR
jgi:hypothetical protein